MSFVVAGGTTCRTDYPPRLGSLRGSSATLVPTPLRFRRPKDRVGPPRGRTGHTRRITPCRHQCLETWSTTKVGWIPPSPFTTVNTGRRSTLVPVSEPLTSLVAYDVRFRRFGVVLITTGGGRPVEGRDPPPETTERQSVDYRGKRGRYEQQDRWGKVGTLQIHE